MAKYGKSLAQVVVEINGKQQVQQVLKAMEESAEKLRAKIDQTKAELEELAKGGTSPEYTKKLGDLKQLEAEEKQIKRALNETKKLNLDINDVLANMSKYSATTLTQTRRRIEATLRAMKPVTEEQRQQMREMQQGVKILSDEINHRMGKLTEFEDIMSDIMNVDGSKLDGVIKRLKELLATTSKFDSENIEKYTAQLAFAEEAKRQRTLRDGRKIMRRVESGKYEASIDVTQADLKALEEYKKLLKTSDTEGLEKTNKVMDRLKQNIKETESGFLSFERAMEKAQGIMSGTFDPTLDDLEQIQKVLKEGMQNKFHIANPEDEAQLKQTLGLMEEMLKKQKEVMRLNHQDKVNAVSGKLDKVSPAEIEEAVKAAKELQQVAKTKEEFIQLGEFIGKAEARLKDWNETSKQSVMKSQIKDLSAIRALSDGALQDQLKFWEGSMNAAKKTSTAYKEAKKNFEDLQGESKRRLQFEGEQTINDVKLGIGDGSTKQMQERLKLLQDYRAIINGTKPDAYKSVDEAILKLTEDIKASQAGFLSFDDALKKAQGVMDGTFKPTLEDLEQIQKVLKEGMQNKFNLVDDADIDQLKETRRLMDEMVKKQAEADRIRLKDQATEIMGGDYTKTIEGTKQAIELLKKYQNTLDTTNPDAINEVTKSINKMKEELESASRAKAAEVMANPMRFSADEINEAIKLTEKLQAATNNATVWENYEQQLIKAREARDRFADDSKYRAMVKQFEDLEDLTANAWAEQKKYWEAMRDSGKHYDEAIAKLKEMQELETTRMKDSSTKTLTTDLLTAGTGDIKQSVEWLTKYQASLEPLGDEWTNINNLIKAGEERLKSITETVSKQNLNEQAGKIMGGDYTKTIEGTKQAIEILKKYQQTLDATDTKGINKVEESIKSMSAELDKAQKASARKTLTADLGTAGTADIKQAVDWLTKYQGTLKPLSPLWKMINKEIEAGNNRLKELSDSTKMTAMTEQFKKYKDLSVNALAEQKKYWTEVKNTYTETDSEYKKAVARLEKIEELEKSRTKAEATPLITEATSGTWDKTIEETEKAIKLIQEYKKQLHTSTDAAAIADANKAIDALNASLGKGKEGLMDYTEALNKAKMISSGGFKGTLQDLEKIQRALKEGMNTRLDLSDPKDIAELQTIQRLLDEIAKEQAKMGNANFEMDAQLAISQARRGSFDGTIEETEKAIKLIQEWKKQLKTSDTTAIDEADEAIAALNLNLGKAKEGLMSYTEAMEKVSRIDDPHNPYEGPLEDLEKVKKSLEEYKKQLKFSDTRGFKAVNDALAKVELAAKRTTYQMSDINTVIDHINSAPLEELKRAAQYLQGELSRVNRQTEDYALLAAKLRDVNAAIKRTTKEWEAQENQIIKTAKRLASYVAVYGGYNFITGKIREAFQANVSLSDSMADVQKTTGMTADEVANLGKQMDALDTRTTQQQLYELAATAGQLGIRGQKDIMGFVEASNMITVALNELGSEGTATLMKIATLTGDITEYGTEEALTRIGSAINDLTATTAATAGPMVDFISRFGGVASSAGIATHEMAAVGATANALGQEIEVAGTSMNQMITAMMSAVRNQSMSFAQALNIDLKVLTDLVNQGKPMEGLVMIFESLQRTGSISAGALKALGSEGARNNRIVTSLVDNLDVLKQNLNTSAQAFEENVSILNEYNIKNENAAAILQRIKNSINEVFSNPVVTERITSWLESLKSLVEWLIKSEGAWYALISAAVQFVAIKVVKNIRDIRDAYRALALEIAILSKSFKDFRVGLSLVATEILGLVKGTKTLRDVWIAFGLVLKTHPIMTIVSIVSAVAGAIFLFGKNTEEASEATEELARNKAELANQLTKNTTEAEKLTEKIKALGAEDKERARLINEFNSKYSKYIGFMLNEKATTDEITEAKKLLNAELEKEYQLRLLQLQIQNLDKGYVDGQVAHIKAISEALKDMGVEDAVINKTIGYINTMVTKGEDLETILAGVNEKYNLSLEATQTKGVTTLDGQSYIFEERNDLGNALNDYIVYAKKYNDQREAFEEQGKTIKEEAAKAAYENQKKWLDSEYAELKKMTGTEGEALEARKTAYSNFYKTLNGYIQSSAGEQKKALQEFMETFKTETGAISELRSLVDIWGASSNLENWTTFGDVIKNLNTASPESLASALDQMEKETKGISEAALATFNATHNTEFDTSSIEKFNDSVYAAGKKLRARLKELNRGVDGNFLWGSEKDGSNEAEKKARKDMNAALAALEEHFLKRKVIIQQAYLDEKISGEEMNRQIADNDEEFRLARIELRKLLAGDANTFNQSLYPELNGKDLQETSRVLQIIGDAVIDGLRKNVQKDETEIREGAIKIRQAFENELLKNDMFGKFENNFRESLDKLELLSSEFERDIAKTISFDVLGEKISGASIMGLDEESQKKRLTALMELSEKSYQINEQGMVDELMKNKEFANWIENLDADKKTVLLQQLRDYYDQRLAVTKQYQDKLAKEFESYYKQSGKQAEYEQGKQKVESSNADIEQMEGIGITRGIDYDGKRQTISDEFDNENKRLIDQMEFYEQRLATMKKGSEEFLAIQQLITDTELERNQLLAQSQRDLTQVYMDEWTKRAERWGQWGEMFGEYLGEQVMLEKQANDARARGDLETAKKIEQQQKQNKQALIQNLLSKIVDEAALWAKEYALKMMFNSLMLTEEKKRAVEEATLQGKSSMLSILLNALTGQSKEHAKGLPGLVTGAIVFAATMALQAFAKSAIANMFPEADTGSTGSRPLSTGMLTYKDGNYPVLGNDGKVYDAKYEGAGMKTGIYGGGAHFGIFSEKQPEMIVDGKTTQKLILNYPYIYDAITTIAKNGRLVNAMPTFATGDYPAGMKPMAPIATVEAPTGNNEQMERTNAVLEQATSVIRELSKVLTSGQISASVDPYANRKATQRAEKFMKRRGID